MTPSSLPISITIGRGNEHESRRVIPLMEQISIRTGRRPRKRPARVHADKNYDTLLVRLYLQNRHIHANIPKRSKKRHVGRPAVFDKKALKKTRYSVERFFSWIKSFRRTDTRYDRLASAFTGFIRIGCILILMREVRR